MADRTDGDEEDKVVDRLALTNPLCCILDKERSDFTRSDMLRLVTGRDIQRLTFHYTGIDGQLKELTLPFGDLAHAERILASGERVDGASLFHGVVDVSASDLYVVPDYRSAFLNPFDSTSLDFICRFLDSDGMPASFTPDNVLRSAYDRFRVSTGLELHALGELEFFLLRDADGDEYVPARGAGYHAAAPFFKCGPIVTEMVRHLEQVTGAVKYAHAEAGFIDCLRSDRQVLAGRRAEQHEIELTPRPIDEMGDIIALSKWVIRNVAYRHGALATFTPKLEEGVPGNGLHVHMELLRNGLNVMVDDGQLCSSALKLIGGLIHYAAPLTAFGNTVAAAFLRLVPDQEAPTRICWSALNRSALIRVPLGWGCKSDLSRVVNPQETCDFRDERGRQTVELRSPDGSALVHLLLAGIVTAADWGLRSPTAMTLAKETEFRGNVFEQAALPDRLEPLPASCVAASRLLLDRRDLFEKDGVFPPILIEFVARMLHKQDDEQLNETLSQMPAEQRLHATRQVMHRDIHKH